jgi:hypothetical protein
VRKKNERNAPNSQQKDNGQETDSNTEIIPSISPEHRSPGIPMVLLFTHKRKK